MIVRRLPKVIVASIVLMLSFALLATPAVSFASTGWGKEHHDHAHNTDPEDACSDAELQATTDTNSTVWMLGGCLGGVLVLIAAQVLEPQPPASALLGQSPEYVATYTDCYQRAAKKRRTNKALTGCLIGVGAYALLYAVLIAGAIAADDDF